MVQDYRDSALHFAKIHAGTQWCGRKDSTHSERNDGNPPTRLQPAQRILVACSEVRGGDPDEDIRQDTDTVDKTHQQSKQYRQPQKIWPKVYGTGTERGA